MHRCEIVVEAPDVLQLIFNVAFQPRDGELHGVESQREVIGLDGEGFPESIFDAGGVVSASFRDRERDRSLSNGLIDELASLHLSPHQGSPFLIQNT